MNSHISSVLSTLSTASFFPFLNVSEVVIALKSGPKHPSYKIYFFLGDPKVLKVFVLSREMVMRLELQEHTYIYFHYFCC